MTHEDRRRHLRAAGLCGTCRKAQTCRENLQGLVAAGMRLTRDHDGKGATWADIDELAWARIEHDNKVATALTIFCADMPDDGRYDVFIRGLHNGKILAHLIDGNYGDD